MDWLPTLLAAAGTQPDPAHPSDGISLLPAFNGQPPVPRKLYWRFHANKQEAMRDGNMKMLTIHGNTFLFNLVVDPLERANLAQRQPEVLKKMKADYAAWNATMLPEDPNAYSERITAKNLGRPLQQRTRLACAHGFTVFEGGHFDGIGVIRRLFLFVSGVDTGSWRCFLAGRALTRAWILAASSTQPLPRVAF